MEASSLSERKCYGECKALSLVHRRPLTQKNRLGVSESGLVREALLPVGSLSTIAYGLPRSS
jgi:hypothetical protein